MNKILGLSLLSGHQERIPELLHSQLMVAIAAVPVRLLPVVLAVRQRPPKDVVKLLLPFGAALGSGLVLLVAVGAVDVLRLHFELAQWY